MEHHISKEGQPSWQAHVLAIVAEFDCAKTPSQRMALLRKLRPLFAGNGARRAALRKCLALTIRAERLGDWEIPAESEARKQVAR